MTRHFARLTSIVFRSFVCLCSFFSATGFAQIDNAVFEPVIAPEPQFNFINLGRESDKYWQSPTIYPEFVCGLTFIEPPINLDEFHLVMEFVGTKETWIPINGKPKTEYLFKVR